MKKYCYFIILISIAFSCNFKNQSDLKDISENIKSINIIIDEKNYFQWPNDLEIKRIIYTPTQDNGLLASLNKLYVSPDENNLAIVDTKLKKIMFHQLLDGITKIFSKIGPGPDEYFEMLDVHINYVSETIEILEYKNIKVYDLNTFEHLKTISLTKIKADLNFMNFINIDDIYYLWTPIPANQRLDLITVSEKNKFHLIKKDVDHIDYFFPYLYGVVLDDKFYPSKGNEEFNLSPLLGTGLVYGVDRSGIKPKYNIQFSSNNPPIEELEKYIGNEIEFANNKYYKHISNIRETEDFLFFNFTGGGNSYNMLYDLKKREAISVGRIKDVNVHIVASNTQYFYCYIFPRNYIDLKKRGISLENHPIFKHIDKYQFEPDDNPIIIQFSIPSTTDLYK
jgi:hypothetical protein